MEKRVQKIHKFKRLKLIFLSATLVTTLQAQIYYVSFPLEVDTILTAWLIKRHKDPNMQLKPLKKGSQPPLAPKYQINFPTALYKRSSRFTSYETAQRILHISPQCSVNLNSISRIIELSPWRIDEFPHVLLFKQKLYQYVPQKISKDGYLDLQKAYNFLDQYCKTGKLK